MFTVRSPGLLGISAALPFMLLYAQALLDALDPQRFSEPISLEPHKFLSVKKTEEQESNQDWSFKMHNSVQREKKKSWAVAKGRIRG